MNSKILSVRIFGQALELRYRNFTGASWRALLAQNDLSEQQFLADIHDPDFFDRYEFPDENGWERSLTLRRFLRTTVYGPDLSRPAFIEIKHGGKKIFRGALQQITGVETLFQLSHVEVNVIEQQAEAGNVRVVCIEESAGLVFNAKVSVQDFDVNAISFRRTFFGGLDFISSIMYAGKALKISGLDALVRGRRAEIIA